MPAAVRSTVECENEWRREGEKLLKETLIEECWFDGLWGWAGIGLLLFCVKSFRENSKCNDCRIEQNARQRPNRKEFPSSNFVVNPSAAVIAADAAVAAAAHMAITINKCFGRETITVNNAREPQQQWEIA